MSSPDSRSAGGSGVPYSGSARAAVEAIWRIESARIIATLTRAVGDFSRAEELAQSALVQALVQWPSEGVPRNPGAWLTTVAKRRAVDDWRRDQRLDDRHRQLASELATAPSTTAGADQAWDREEITDDVLRLIFISCHPILGRDARVTLTLRVVAGLSSDQLAAALLVPVATVQQRVVRAKKTLAEADIPFALPPPQEFTERLGSVLNVLYLIFNEGYVASSGEQWQRPDLAREALRLARMLAELVPDEPEAHGLVALMELHSSRTAARTTANGDPVLLADQDRTRWDRSQITRGLAALDRMDALGHGRGAYGLQAAIARCHAVAPSVEQTDWDSIVTLYEALGEVAPSPMVDLNRAVAVSMATGPADGLAILDTLTDHPMLRGHHLLPGVRGELLIRLDRPEEAAIELQRAAELTANVRERQVLLDKITKLTGRDE
ncbi:RNA polymerase sigma factor [Propionibacteriaceae bacterium Y1685]|uniref:RNA polymerase sigma factor n=1 Tax=Microlunatus sp. Y1700 TaxID=3418487 RepID=UPI003B76330D